MSWKTVISKSKSAIQRARRVSKKLAGEYKRLLLLVDSKSLPGAKALPERLSDDAANPSDETRGLRHRMDLVQRCIQRLDAAVSAVEVVTADPNKTLEQFDEARGGLQRTMHEIEEIFRKWQSAN